MSKDYGDIKLGDQLSDFDVQATISGPASPLTILLGGNFNAKRINDITGALTINFDKTLVEGGAQIGDEVILIVEGAAISPGTITWGTNILTPTGLTTLVTVANKKKLVRFTYDGDAYFLYVTAIQP